MKMKVVQINATCGSGSTGKICVSVSELLNENGVENYILYSLGNSTHNNSIKFSTTPIRYIQTVLEKISGRYGFCNYISTAKLINQLKKLSPDIVHIHNIHSHDVNLDTLFQYLKKYKIKVFWTFHDCWAFTGGCAHFDGIGCNGYLSCCGNCPSYKKHSFFFDRTRSNYLRKVHSYSEGIDLTIITPSAWLGNLVKQSLLKNYPVLVINNGIDLNIFKPTESNFRIEYNCVDKTILLGVAFGWGPMKGLDVFIRLANELPDSFQIVLVGTNDSIDKQLPSNVISIHRTANQGQLAEIYSAADLFVQLTREENFPTVNIEALACGTPVLTFDTGGSKEMLDDNCGIVVKKNDYDTLFAHITDLSINKDDVSQLCVKRASLYNKDNRFIDYLNLYFNV